MNWTRFSNPAEDRDVERWYVERLTHGGRRLVLYGPFPDEHSAKVAGYLAHSFEDREAANQTLHGLENYLSSLAHRYTQAEIEYGMERSHEIGYSSFALRPASALRRHPSWAEWDRTIRRVERYPMPGDQSFADLMVEADFKP